MKLGKPMTVGNTAEIYLNQNAIIKLFHEDFPHTESSREADKMRFAYSSGLCVPKVLDVTKIHGKQAIIMEYVNGRTMGDIISSEPDETGRCMDRFVGMQRQIHEIVADSVEPMSDRLARQIESAPMLDSNLRSLLLRKLESMSFEKRLCHGDYHFFNLVVSDTKVIVLDWADATSGDTRADICRSYLLLSGFSRDLADMYLESYCKTSGLMREEVLQWMPMIAAARLRENVPSERPERLLNMIHQYLGV